MGKIVKSKLQEKKDLETKMNTLSDSMYKVSSGTPDGSYTKATLAGAASGAALGTSINAGWGTLIGGVVGAGAGAIGNAVDKKQKREAEEKNAAKNTLDNEIKTQQLKGLKQQYVENQISIDWMTKLKNRFKYR